MFENIANFFRKLMKSEKKEPGSRDAAKERLHLVLMQDRANVSADFLELMKQEIIEVIKKYIEVDEKEIDVRLTNKENEDGTNGAPALYANIPILNIRNEMKKEVMTDKVGESIARPEETIQENADAEVSIAPQEEVKETEETKTETQETTNLQEIIDSSEEMKQENADAEATIDCSEEAKQENVDAGSSITCPEETVQENGETTEEQNVETVNQNAQVVNQTNNI